MQATEPPAPRVILARPNNRLALIMLATTAVYAFIIHELLWSSDFGLNISQCPHFAICGFCGTTTHLFVWWRVDGFGSQWPHLC